MAKSRILYIDEEAMWRDNFVRYVHDVFDVDAIPPVEDQELLLEYIRTSSADAVILDHLLSENMPEITYDGVDIVKRLKEENSRFPLFVLTSHDVKAMEEAEDVNYVYPKSVISIKEKTVEGKGAFNDRIRLQIKHYEDSIKKAESELAALLKKADEGPLNADDEERLIELDGILAEQLGKHLDIPDHLKSTANAELTQELISVSEQIIQKLNEKNADNA